jgi:hypothetical protein
MPKLSIASNLLAFFVTGDIAGLTVIQNRQRHRIAYAKTYPKRHRSPGQNIQRNRFSQAINAWRELSAEQKTTLDTIAKRLRMPMSGYNLYLSCYLRERLEWIAEWAQDHKLSW